MTRAEEMIQDLITVMNICAVEAHGACLYLKEDSPAQVSIWDVAKRLRDAACAAENEFPQLGERKQAGAISLHLQ